MFNIAILGCGVVGSGVADILFDKQESLSKRFNQEVKLSKILDIKNMDGTPYAPYLVTEPADVFEDDSIKLVVVTIGGLDLAADRCFAALNAGKHVVTSNKAVVAAYGRELTKLAYEKNVRFLYACGSFPHCRRNIFRARSNRLLHFNGHSAVPFAFRGNVCSLPFHNAFRRFR